MRPVWLSTRIAALQLLGCGRAVLVVGCLALLAFAGGLSVVVGQEPTREYRFEGRANIDGAPAPKGTVVEIRVKGEAIATSQVTDEQGTWAIVVDANVLKQGVCDAIFYVGGKQAERQWNRCTVSIVLEVSKPPLTTPPIDHSEELPPDDDPPGDDPPGDDPPGDDPPGDDPPGDDPPGDDPPGDDPPTDDPPTDDSPTDDPPSDDPSTDDTVYDSTTPPSDASDDDDDGDDDEGAADSSTQRPGAPPRTGSGGLIKDAAPSGRPEIAIVVATIVLVGIAVFALPRRRRS